MKNLIKILAILILICPLTGCGQEETKEPSKSEVSSKIKDVTKDNLIFRNTSITSDENGSTVITEIENTGSAPRKIQTITLEFKDKDGNVVDSYASYVGDTIEAGESIANISKTSVELSSVTSIEYMVN